MDTSEGCELLAGSVNSSLVKYNEAEQSPFTPDAMAYQLSTDFNSNSSQKSLLGTVPEDEPVPDGSLESKNSSGCLMPSSLNLPKIRTPRGRITRTEFYLEEPGSDPDRVSFGIALSYQNPQSLPPSGLASIISLVAAAALQTLVAKGITLRMMRQRVQSCYIQALPSNHRSVHLHTT